MTPDSALRVWSPAVLARAWARVEANGGAAGADGVGVTEFAARHDWELRRLGAELRVGSYEPMPARTVLLPAPGRAPRVLEIPAVRDRVVQTALAQRLSAAADVRFDDASHGYRPRRGVHSAVCAARSLLRDGAWTVDADIRRFFESADLRRLLRDLPAWEDDAERLALVERWLRAAGARGKGLPLGSPLSPVLANIALHGVDLALREAGIAAVRYAEDIIAVADSESAAGHVHAMLGKALAEIGLELHPDKTRLIRPGQPFRFLGATLSGPASARAAPTAGRPAPDAGAGEAALEAAEAVADNDADPCAAECARKGGAAAGPAVTAASDMRTLYIVEPGVLLRCDGERLVIVRGREPIASLPIGTVDAVVVLANAAVTSAALRLALRHGVTFVLLERNGRFVGRLEGDEGHFLAVQRAQFAVSIDAAMVLDIARGWVLGKVGNSIGVLQRQARHHPHIALGTHLSALRQMREQARHVASLEALRGIEGFAARSHFAALRELLGPQWGFETRARRPSPDPINALLNLGYSMLFRNVEAAVAAHGLVRHLGFLHAPRSGHPALVSDMMEEFRAPVVDTLVLHLTITGRLRPQDFETADDGNCVLEASALRRFIAAFEARMGGDESGEGGWRTTIDRQVRAFVDFLRGRVPKYEPLRVR